MEIRNRILTNRFELHKEKSKIIVKDIYEKQYLRVDEKLIRIIEINSKNQEELCSNYEKLFKIYINKNNKVNRKLSFKKIDKYISFIINIIPKNFFKFKVCIIIICMAVLLGIYINNVDINIIEEVDIKLKVLFLFFNILLHEIGHALVCKYYDREIIDSGIKLNYGAPVFYINTTDICMKGKKARIHTSLGGVYGNAILMILSILFFKISDANFSTIKEIVNLSLTFILFNLIPFLKLDGYYILSDIFNINNLNKNSKKIFLNFIYNRKIKNKDIVYITYYIMNLMFICVVLYSLIYTLIFYK